MQIFRVIAVIYLVKKPGGGSRSTALNTMLSAEVVQEMLKLCFFINTFTFDNIVCVCVYQVL